MEDYVYFCRGRFNSLMSSLIFRIQLASRMGSSRRETSVDITDHGWHLDGGAPSSTCDTDLPVPLVLVEIISCGSIAARKHLGQNHVAAARINCHAQQICTASMWLLI